jgi:hypothetical protein
MARVRSGQALAWPLLLTGVSAEVSGVKRDFACAFTRHFLTCTRRPAVTVALEVGGANTYTLRAIPGRSRARILGTWEDLRIKETGSPVL